MNGGFVSRSRDQLREEVKHRRKLEKKLEKKLDKLEKKRPHPPDSTSKLVAKMEGVSFIDGKEGAVKVMSPTQRGHGK